MSASYQLESDRDLIISTPPASFDLAVSSLCKHLALSQSEAAAQLRRGRIAMPSDDSARHLKGILQALGVAMMATKTKVYTACIRASERDEATIQTVARIAALRPATVAAELAAPWGMILTDLPDAEVERLQKALRRHTAITFCFVENATARADLFAPVSMSPHAAHALARYIALRGLRPCPISGAFVGDVTLTEAAAITSRFAECGLRVLPRSFQRFDLYLTGIGRLSAAEAADFLLMRGNQSGWMAQSVSAQAPLRLDTDLGRSAALAFCADYAAIGLEVAPRLVTGNS